MKKMVVPCHTSFNLSESLDVVEPPTVPASDANGAPDVVEGGDKKKRRRRRGKKKKKKKAEDGATADATEELQKLKLKDAPKGASLKSLKRDQLYDLFGIRREDDKDADAKNKAHKFWDTQPVPKISEDTSNTTEIGPIDKEKTVADVRSEPYALPKGFKWDSLNVKDSKVVQEIYKLLTENYVEDDDNMFRFDYSVDFLLWALQPPGYHREWHVGVRQVSNNKLRGIITGVPATVSIHSKNVPMAEINFLCVHKKLRAKRLAPVLIKEVTRRINRKGIWQAVYTAGVVLPKPIGKCRYWHRSLNPKKLIDVGFSRIGARMTLARTIKLYKLPAKPAGKLRPMTKADVPSACKLLNTYLAKFKLHIHFDEDDFAHWLLPRKDVIDTFVISDEKTGNVTDMVSMYHLPSSIIGHHKYKTLRAVYSFYNVATSMTLEQLIQDCLIAAKNFGADVFNALDLMENKVFLKNLKFGMGDGHLQYYLYNWRSPTLESENVGIVLL
eukprot:g2815.t1